MKCLYAWRNVVTTINKLVTRTGNIPLIAIGAGFVWVVLVVAC